MVSPVYLLPFHLSQHAELINIPSAGSMFKDERRQGKAWKKNKMEYEFAVILTAILTERVKRYKWFSGVVRLDSSLVGGFGFLMPSWRRFSSHTLLLAAITQLREVHRILILMHVMIYCYDWIFGDLHYLLNDHRTDMI